MDADTVDVADASTAADVDIGQGSGTGMDAGFRVD